MKPYSLTRRLILTVLLLETALALATAAATLLYERQQHLRAFDIMLRGRADSLLGAVQDAEDPEDNVALDPKALDLQRKDAWAVRDLSGRVVGRSAVWRAGLEKNFEESGKVRNFRVNGKPFRGLVIHGIRQIDQSSDKPGIARPVAIFYAASLRPVTRALEDMAKFLLMANSLLLLFTGTALLVLLRRGLRPLQQLSRAAAAITPERWQFQAPASASDVKELGILATALDSAMRRLDQSFRQQQAFVHDAAHELKTAVTIVKSSLQLLSSKRRTSAEYAAGLDTCLTDCSRMEDLVLRMLMLARFEQRSNSSLCQRETTDLSERVEEVCSQVESMAELGKVNFEVRAAESAPVRLSTEACETLAANLIVNALQHTPAQGFVRVSVQLAAGSALLVIEDTGTGIGPGEQPHLFERFYRGDPSRSRHTGGAGLGMAISKAIADSCGGTIEVWSEAGSGTRVTVTLPLAPSSDWQGRPAATSDSLCGVSESESEYRRGL